MNDLINEIADFIETCYHRSDNRSDLPGRKEAVYNATGRGKGETWSEQFSPPEIAQAVRDKFLVVEE